MPKYCVRCENVVHVLRARETLVGRSSSCTISLSQAKVSRVHAVFRTSTEGVEVVDLGSMNGTRVNGQRLRGPRRLTTGDVVQVGGASFEFFVEQEGQEDGTTTTTTSGEGGEAEVDPTATLGVVELLVRGNPQEPATFTSARALLDNLFARLLQSRQCFSPEERAQLSALSGAVVTGLSPAEGAAYKDRLQRRAEELERLKAEDSR